MTYDPKKRPVFLGFEHDRTNPNRLTQGVLSVADQNENQIAPIPKPPSALQQAAHIGKIIMLVLASLAGSIVALKAGGVPIPEWLLGIAAAIAALAGALGIASPGLKKPEAAPPDELK